MRTIVIVIALATLASARPAFADQTDLDTLRAQIDKDQAALSELTTRVNASQTPNASELATFLQSTVGPFQTAESAYRSMTFTDSTLREVADFGARGANLVSTGALQTADALRRSDTARLQVGLGRMNSGVDNLDRAARRYNAYQDAHPSATRWLVDLADGPRRLTLLLAPIVLGASVYFSLAGVALNQLFQRRVRLIVRGAVRPRTLRRGLLNPLYGAHLLLLVGLGYLLVVFSGLFVLVSAVFAADWIVRAPLIPIALIVAVPAVVLACFWGMLKGLLGIQRAQTLGVDVGPADEPRLWAMSRQVAAEMGTRHADRIILSPLPGIGVHEQGGLLELAMNGTRRVLTIGAPSIVDLSVPQFRAILGHEYAHISNKDTRWTALTFRAFSAVQQTIVAMDAIGQRRGWFALVALLNPARWVILGYLWLFAYVTTGFSRLREVLADVAAVETYGAEAFKGGLRTVMLNDSLFGQRGLPAMLTLAREGRQLADVYRAMEQTKAAMYPWDLEQAWDLAARGSPSAFDSHPAVKDRLHYADVVVDRGQTIAPGLDQHEALWTWFADWSARCTQLTELLNSRLKTA